MMNLNLNDNIKVKLTEFGEKIIDSEYAELRIAYPDLDLVPLYVPDDEGYYQFQIWEFMKIFGKYMLMTLNQVIVDNNIIVVPKGENLNEQ